MKTVRTNQLTFLELFKVKHELELQKMDTVNMSDVMDVVVWRYKELVEALREADEEALDIILNTTFTFEDKAEVVAKPNLGSHADDDEDEDEDDEEEAPKPKKKAKKKTSKAAAKKTLPS